MYNHKNSLKTNSLANIGKKLQNSYRVNQKYNETYKQNL